MKKLYFFILMVFLFAGKMVAAQSFTTRVSAKVIGKKDVVQLEYVAENLDLLELVLPVFKNWTIVSGPNFSSNRLQTGNIVKQETIFTLILQPLASGQLTIPGAKATVDNRTKLSNVVTVEVKNTDHVQGNTPAMGAPRQSAPAFPPMDEEDINDEQVLKGSESARDKIKDNLLVRLDVNKKSSYVGEPLLVTYKLYTRIRSQSRVVKQPTFKGCTVLEMTSDDPLPQHENIGGKRYNVYIIRQVQLIPLQAGPLLLPETSVENTVTFYRASSLNYRDLFYNNPSSKPEELTVTFKNAPAQVEVKPLPQPAPANFNGAVGNFTLALNTSDGSDASTNGNVLLLSISGEGNLQQSKAPQVTWPKGMEGFEPTENEEINKQVFPVKINKTFSYPYVASKNGRYAIAPIEFTYFDPAKNKYITVISNPINLNVVKATNKIYPQTFENKGSVFYNRLYLVLGLGLIALLIGLILYHRRTKKVVAQPTPPILKQEVIAAAPYVDTDQFIFQVRELEPNNDGPAFYKQLHRSISAWLLGKYNISVSEIDAFSEQNSDKAVALQKLSSVLQNCSLGMYTPMYNFEEAMQHRLMALEAMNHLEKNV